MENTTPFFAPSPYIINQDPFKFGGQQKAYQELANQAIDLALKKVEGCQTEEELTPLFFEILEDFAKFRQNIAQSHRTLHAEKFGTRRDLEGVNDFYFTPLDGTYLGYNATFLKWIATLLQDKPLDRKEHEKIIIPIESDYEDCQSSFELEVVEGIDPKVKDWNTPIQEISKDFPTHLLKKREENQGLEPFERAILREGFEKLKKEKPETYKKTKMQTLFLKLNKEFPSPTYTMVNGRPLFNGREGNLKSFYAIGTARFLVNGKMFASSQYIIWLYRDFKNHPLKRMQQDTIATVIHQDNFLIPDSLKEIAKRFAQSVMYKGENVKELKDRVGLFRFYLAQTMPWERGSASAGDMLETLLYRFQRYQVTYNPQKMVDLEALTKPLVKEFMANYDSMINLKPLLI